MTREEAIGHLRVIITYAENDGYTELAIEALEMAIKALEQEPCDDAISRTDVKKYLSAPDANGDRVIYESDLDLLPPVTPKPKTDVLNKIRAEIEECKQYRGMTGNPVIDKHNLGLDKYYDLGLEKAIKIIDKYTAE